jgi:hypothetical protein
LLLRQRLQTLVGSLPFIIHSTQNRAFQNCVWLRHLRVIWKLLHEGATYTDAGCQLTPETSRRRMLKCVKGVEALGFRVTVTRNTPIAGTPA